MSPSLQTTPLHNFHTQARLVEFGGWLMPVQYQGIMAEHQSVRQRVGMFDVSHMGKFTVVATPESLQKLVPSNLKRLTAGQAQYTVLLNEVGGIIDDVIFYCHGANNWSLIVNAATTAQDRQWLLDNLKNCEFCDRSHQQTLIALQGPQAAHYLQTLIKASLNSVKKFNHITTEIFGSQGFIARTGYTGEDGFEIMTDIATGQELWQRLQEMGVTPCGLGCRDTLRLEAGMHLYGQDLDATTTPIEAGLEWLVHFEEKADFMGRSHLESQLLSGVTKQFVAIEMQTKNIARHGYPILFDGEVVGIVTSGTQSPTLNRAIALGYIPPYLAAIGQCLDVQIRNQTYPAKVVKRPFYQAPPYGSN